MSYETGCFRKPRDRDDEPPDSRGDSRRDWPLGGDRVRPRHEAIRQEQVGRARRRLDALDDLTDAQRRTVEELSRRLVASLSPLAAAVEGDANSPASASDDD